MKVLFSIDSSVPPEIAHSITKLVSPYGEVKFGLPLIIPSLESDSDTIVFGDDRDENIVLATVISPGDTSISLNANTTALVFVRMGIGPVPRGMTPTQVNKAIESTPEFPKLIERINTALKNASIPMEDNAVAQSIVTTLNQTMKALKTPTER